MALRCSSITNSASRFSYVLMPLLALFAPPARADVCVWRDPERTMQNIFPEARDYKTITVKFARDKVSAIEKQLGSPIEEASQGEFNFYDIVGAVGGKPRKMGTIIALAGKGEYGVIEVVIGVDNAGKILGAYIQRSRERVTKALESPAFLDQFKGKTKASSFDVGSAIKPASADAETASRTVAFVIRKMLVFYQVLDQGEKP